MDDVLALLVPQKETPPPVAAGEGAQKVNCQAEIVDTPTDQVKQVGAWVSQYLAAGFALVPIAAGSKGPNVKGWNRRDGCVTRQEDAARITQGVGLAHAYSRTACLDVDDIDKAREWLSGQGVDLDALLHAADAVGISSGRPGRAKLLYRLPAGVEPLATKNLGEAAGLELRCATADGLTVQDVLPPSIHPETGKPYAWWFGDDLVGSVGALPDLPAELLAIWRELDKPAAQPEQRAVGVGLDTLRECLSAIPLEGLPRGPSPGANWLGVGMALHHETGGGAIGLDLWDEWSATDPARYKGRDDLVPQWESFGKRTGGAALTLRTLARWAGVDLNRPDVSDFEDLSGEGPRANRFEFLPAGQFMQSRPARWIIKGLLPQAGLGVIYGESGSGKSFLVLDMMLAITRGTSWRQRRVVRGAVAYVVAEGAGGFRGRLQAYSHHIAADLGPFFVLGDAPNIVERKTIDDLIASLLALGPVSVIVLDTLAQVTPGANENSGEDMGLALANCRRIHQATGALVLLVHHSGKDATRGARGWSGLKAAADVELEVLRADDQRAVRVTKQKDGQDGEDLGFRLRPVVLGLDEDGDEVTSCVVEHVDVPMALRRGRVKVGSIEQTVLGVLSDQLEADSGAVLISHLVDVAVAQIPRGDAVKDRRREHVMRAVDTLQRKARICIEGDRVNFPPESLAIPHEAS